MADQDHLDEELTANWELERALTKLNPAASRIDRDRLLFLAGRASAEADRHGPFSFGSRWGWPAATVLSSAAALVLAVILETRSGGTVGSRPEPIDVASNRSHAVETVPNPVVPEGSIAERNNSAAPMGTANDEEMDLATEFNTPWQRSLALAHGIEIHAEPPATRRAAPNPRVEEEPPTQRDLLRQFLKTDGSEQPISAGRAG